MSVCSGLSGRLDPRVVSKLTPRRSLAALNNVDYVTPALVGLAARKVYLHRIRLVAPEKERSVAWGSDVELVRKMLKGITPDVVIEDVLSMVGAPL